MVDVQVWGAGPFENGRASVTLGALILKLADDLEDEIKHLERHKVAEQEAVALVKCLNLLMKFDTHATGPPGWKVAKLQDRFLAWFDSSNNKIPRKWRTGTLENATRIQNAYCPLPQIPRGCRVTRDEFWKLIDKSRRGVADLDEQVGKLVGLVSKLEPKEILSFERRFQECVRDAFREDLWAAANIINGGCSDDSFDYFLGWLIAQGRKYYEAALADAEQAGRRVDPGEEVECGDLWIVAVQAYEARTGKDDFYEIAPDVPRRLRRMRAPDLQIDERFPKLAKKFNA